MFYHYNKTTTGFVAVSEVHRHPCLEDVRNIPLENAVLENGKLYDNREIEYRKLIKAKENQSSAYAKIEAGLEVEGIKIITTAESTNTLNSLLSLAVLEGNSKAPIKFRDYESKWHSVSYEQFKSICLQVGQHCRSIDESYTKNMVAIEQAKTIEELKAIVI